MNNEIDLENEGIPFVYDEKKDIMILNFIKNRSLLRDSKYFVDITDNIRLNFVGDEILYSLEFLNFSKLLNISVECINKIVLINLKLDYKQNRINMVSDFIFIVDGKKKVLSWDF